MQSFRLYFPWASELAEMFSFRVQSISPISCGYAVLTSSILTSQPLATERRYSDSTKHPRPGSSPGQHLDAQTHPLVWYHGSRWRGDCTQFNLRRKYFRRRLRSVGACKNHTTNGALLLTAPTNTFISANTYSKYIFSYLVKFLFGVGVDIRYSPTTFALAALAALHGRLPCDSPSLAPIFRVGSPGILRRVTGLEFASSRGTTLL